MKESSALMRIAFVIVTGAAVLGAVFFLAVVVFGMAVEPLVFWPLAVVGGVAILIAAAVLSDRFGNEEDNKYSRDVHD